MPLETNLSGPMSVLIDVNSYCQLRCRYCSSMPFDGSLLEAERVISLLKELGEFPIWSLTFSGGEPFLHPNMIDFIEASWQSGLVPSINTNGLKLLNGKLLQRLVKLHNKGIKFTLNISLDSNDPIDNDTARGKGKDVNKAIKIAISNGLQVDINSTIHSGNINSALNLIDEYPGVKQFRFTPVIPTHSSLTSGMNLVVEEKRMEKFWQKALKLQDELGEDKIRLPFQRDKKKALMDCKQNHCFCGITTCFIDSYFDVYPCNWSKIKDNKMGNVKNTSLKSIWNSTRAIEIREKGQKARLCEALPSLNPDSGDLPARYKGVNDQISG
ncbi:radical SAM protein [Bacillus halotolerans]|uniref:radical SAM protein n=1 Tax=Bacillus halotolerans TaxID=260554 RepID=UPI00192C50B3|nr:radical SAM protein [Bacillus halotolerans]MBL4963931.1 radical SAM protein [Bacillus halotolerans]